MAAVAGIENGKVVAEYSATQQGKKSSGDQLGKDAFLQLLVAEMQNQDPLEPSTNTEYISQLAQFSSLEEMENVNTTVSNQSAFSLVGKNVIIDVGSSEGKVTQTVAGAVEYVEMKEGKAYLGVNGDSYSIDDLNTVIDDAYLEALMKEVAEADK